VPRARPSGVGGVGEVGTPRARQATHFNRARPPRRERTQQVSQLELEPPPDLLLHPQPESETRACAARRRSPNPITFCPSPKAALQSPRAPAPADSPDWHSAQGIPAPRHGKHFLHLDDFSRDELEDMIARARDAKRRLYARDASFRPFESLSLAMIFTKPSARTRVSFETVSGWLVD
jgi:hypothetical protein